MASASLWVLFDDERDEAPYRLPGDTRVIYEQVWQDLSEMTPGFSFDVLQGGVVRRGRVVAGPSWAGLPVTPLEAEVVSLREKVRAMEAFLVGLSPEEVLLKSYFGSAEWVVIHPLWDDVACRSVYRVSRPEAPGSEESEHLSMVDACLAAYPPGGYVAPETSGVEPDRVAPPLTSSSTLAERRERISLGLRAAMGREASRMDPESFGPENDRALDTLNVYREVMWVLRRALADDPEADTSTGGDL